jgi:hypothetical protein
LKFFGSHRGVGTQVAIYAIIISLSRLPSQREQDHDCVSLAGVRGPECFAVTIFTNRYAEVRDFYVEILNALVISEQGERACVLEVGGMPFCLRQTEHGELVSYFHLHLELKNQASVLSELRRRGIIVTSVGPYTNFRDPEGRVIKLSQKRTAVC